MVWQQIVIADKTGKKRLVAIKMT